jgi:peptide/nickel transport system ATP-binding protein
VFDTPARGVRPTTPHDAVIMQNGQLRETGPVAQVLAHPVDPYTIRLIDAVPDPDAGGPADRASD